VKMRSLMSVIGLTLAPTLFLPSNADAATWCGPTKVVDVICYSDGACYVTADAYGGVRYYRINPDDPSREEMVSVALATLLSGGNARLAFAPHGLNCNDIPQDTHLLGVGATVQH